MQPEARRAPETRAHQTQKPADRDRSAGYLSAGRREYALVQIDLFEHFVLGEAKAFGPAHQQIAPIAERHQLRI